MQGYIRPYAPELRLRDYQYYRGVYCGLCRSMGKCTGQCSRMSLSYDFVFLALTRLALLQGNPSEQNEDRSVHFERRRCLVHPLRRRLSLERGAVTDYVACAAAVLNHQKLLDDCTDEHGIKKWRARALLPAFRAFCRRAEHRYDGLRERIEPHMRSLSQMESQKLASADQPADAFGAVLGELFAYGLDESSARVAHHIGHHVGRWLYLIDAIDDYEEDITHGRYNPLYCLYGEATLSEQAKASLKTALCVDLERAADALDLIEPRPELCGEELLPLLYHILTVALPKTTHEILFPCKTDGRCGGKRKKERLYHDRSL